MVKRHRRGKAGRTRRTAPSTLLPYILIAIIAIGLLASMQYLGFSFVKLGLGVRGIVHDLSKPNCIFHQGAVYCAYLKNDKIMLFKLLSKGASKEYIVADNPIEGDDHSSPIIFADSYGRLHIFFTEHCGSLHHYYTPDPIDLNTWTYEEVEGKLTFSLPVNYKDRLYVVTRDTGTGCVWEIYDVEAKTFKTLIEDDVYVISVETDGKYIYVMWSRVFKPSGCPEHIRNGIYILKTDLNKIYTLDGKKEVDKVTPSVEEYFLVKKMPDATAENYEQFYKYSFVGRLQTYPVDFDPAHRRVLYAESVSPTQLKIKLLNLYTGDEKVIKTISKPCELFFPVGGFVKGDQVVFNGDGDIYLYTISKSELDVFDKGYYVQPIYNAPGFIYQYVTECPKDKPMALIPQGELRLGLEEEAATTYRFTMVKYVTETASVTVTEYKEKPYIPAGYKLLTLLLFFGLIASLAYAFSSRSKSSKGART